MKTVYIGVYVNLSCQPTYPIIAFESITQAIEWADEADDRDWAAIHYYERKKDESVCRF